MRVWLAVAFVTDCFTTSQVVPSVQMGRLCTACVKSWLQYAGDAAGHESENIAASLDIYWMRFCHLIFPPPSAIILRNT